MTTIRVQVIVEREGTSYGRYNIPENEYKALVEYLTRKTAENLIFKVLGKTLFEPDDFRPWAIR